MRRCFLVLLGLLALALTAWRPVQPVAVSHGFAIYISWDGQLLIAPQATVLEPVITDEEQPVVPDRTPYTTVQTLIDKAIADLGRRLQVSTDEIMLWSFQSATFRDASLGRPQPGGMYAQVITPGYKITLRSGDALYTYHAARMNVVFAGQVGEPPDNPPDATR